MKTGLYVCAKVSFDSYMIYVSTSFFSMYMFISVHIPFKLHYSNYLKEGRWHMEMKNKVL